MAQISEIRLKVNGKTQRVFTADELNKLNILNGPQSAEGLAWATGADTVSTFQIEVDIKAYTASGTAETPRFKAEVDDSFVTDANGRLVEAGLGLISKRYNVQIPVASGWNDFMLFPKERGEVYQQISLIDYANVVEFEIKVNNTIVRQDTKGGNEAKLIARDMLPAPTSTATPANLAVDIAVSRATVDIVFDHDDLLSSGLPMTISGRKVSDFNLRINTTTSGNIKAIYQILGPPD